MVFAETVRRPIVPTWLDVYPEEADKDDTNTLMAMASWASLMLRKSTPPHVHRARLQAAVARVNANADRLAGLSDEELQAMVGEMRRALRAGGLMGASVETAFALIREICSRRIGLRPYDVQIMAGWALLNGQLAEMETGEGKTLSAIPPVGTIALAGVPVHVFTVNDYLAQRDADYGRPVLEALGLSIGVVVEGMEPEARRAAYASDVVYGTYKQIVFDFLRDRLVLRGRPDLLNVKAGRLAGENAHGEALLMRGLHCAIVDEADSVLIDEARTPLILSRKSRRPAEQELAADAMALAGMLQLGTHYKVHHLERRIELTEAGRERLAAKAEAFGPLFSGKRRREEKIVQALYGLTLLKRGEHYLVKDGKIQIVDEFTGRTMPDRTWSHGLHQMVECKEQCEPSAQSETLAQITTQRFFRRYRHLAGMTGTAHEVEGELWSVYRLPVVGIPKRKKGRRVITPALVMCSKADKWKKVAERTVSLKAGGQPVLIGTRTVAASEEVSDALTEAGVPHRVLNADQDSAEAEIVAQAGQAGQVTVATNMAGRGTDIALGEGVAVAGGLTVIMTERHDSGRIDRQLIGRCARQDNPGRVEIILSMEDDLVMVWVWPRVLGTVTFLSRVAPKFALFLGRRIFDRAQLRIERLHARMRRTCVIQDRQLSRLLAFSGLLE